MTDLRTAAQRLLGAVCAALPYAPHRVEFDVVADTADALRAALAEPVQDVGLPSLCSAIAKHLGESWLVVGPDGSRFVAPTPFRAASAANKHFGRLHHDPEKAAEFAAMIDKVRRDSERENDRLMAMYGSLNCPTCGGSGHIGDAASPAVQEQAEPDAYGYASRLAVAIWENHYKETAPHWKPLDDLMGVLTQIDNMTSGLTRLAQQAEPVEPVATVTECEACFTPDVCQLRGTCDYYTASQMRIAAPPQQDEPAQQAEPVEPYCYVYEYDGVFGLHREFYPLPYNGIKPSRTVPVYTAPPQRKPLTQEEIPALAEQVLKLSVYYDVWALLGTDGLVALVRAVERAHGIKE